MAWPMSPLTLGGAVRDGPAPTAELQVFGQYSALGAAVDTDRRRRIVVVINTLIGHDAVSVEGADESGQPSGRRTFQSKIFLLPWSWSHLCRVQAKDVAEELGIFGRFQMDDRHFARRCAAAKDSAEFVHDETFAPFTLQLVFHSVIQSG